MGGSGKGASSQSGDLRAFFQSGGKSRPQAGGKFGPSGASDNDNSPSTPTQGGRTMTPTDKQRMKNIAKGAAAGGAIGGFPGMVAGGIYGGVGNQWPGTEGGSGELNPRSRMKGRTLVGGEIPMRRGSSHGRYPVGGPPLRHGSSLLGSDNDEDTGYSSSQDKDGYGGFGHGL